MVYWSGGPSFIYHPLDKHFLLLLPFSLGLAPFGILLPLANIFHSSTFSIELMESSDTSITDCWYSRGVSALMVMVASAMAPPPPVPPGVGVTLGIGVGPPSVP